MGLYSAIAMSLSGMMGSGLFTVLGCANLTAKSHFPVAGGPAGYIVSNYGNGLIA